MSVDERWTCLEHWYSIGHLQMLAWKPRTMPHLLTPLPSEDCWWHSAFPGKQSQIRSSKRKRRTQPGRLAPQFRESGETLPGTMAYNSQNSRESVPVDLDLLESRESILRTLASESRTSQELVPGTLTTLFQESQELIPGSVAIQSRDPTPDSQLGLPTQPYSASTALARVSGIHTAANIRRREGHSQYQLGLEQRRINREIRRAARQDALPGGSIEIPHQALDPDAGPTGLPTGIQRVSPSDNDANAVDVLVSEKPNRLQRQLRKRKRNMAISDSESEGLLDDAPGPSHHAMPPNGDSAVVPNSRSRKGSFVVLLSPVQQPRKSIKPRLGK
jgi:hypothetical protein